MSPGPRPPPANRYEKGSKRIRLSPNVERRDENGIKKTVSAFLKILRPREPLNDAELDEYVATRWKAAGGLWRGRSTASI
ncbi:hypothetical protein CKO31_07870 [Thiohalocapsa halophila]|uniref:Uncharacterized protein n=1 Tax=Thiohalocapsa halophila TaxID=69359 RepID=A0ABS1CFI0_9GAMM|nr:BREX system Lon protease-like protein BrxL [Thiohalocapsa halophila]MBK1630661.1 hypothetical protein [Thiohalocapsa halophila]